MRKTASRSVTFRPSKEVWKWLEAGQKSGFGLAHLLNDLLEMKRKDKGPSNIEVYVRAKIKARAQVAALMFESEHMPSEAPLDLSNS